MYYSRLKKIIILLTNILLPDIHKFKLSHCSYLQNTFKIQCTRMPVDEITKTITCDVCCIFVILSLYSYQKTSTKPIFSNRIKWMYVSFKFHRQFLIFFYIFKSLQTVTALIVLKCD